MKQTELSKFDNSWYDPGGGTLKRLVWYFANILFLMSPWNPSSRLKVWILRLFGARIGKGVVIKPKVNVKYPWNLEVGNFVWIGEGVWIDNLTSVRIGDNVCLSQGAMLLCGNHNYKKPTFDLIVGHITLEEGAWMGAKSVAVGGITMKSHSVLSVNSVANKDLEAYCDKNKRSSY